MAGGTGTWLLLILSASMLIRYAISLWPYSGAGKPPMFGDYEAQRHWMEITNSIPLSEWYHNTTRNDLHYWGLDYPPLTAYHSWLCGHVEPESMALYSSRGYETSSSKLYMRLSISYIFPLVILFLRDTNAKTSTTNTFEHNVRRFSPLFVALMQPALMLIDHGHFQYNSVSLGLSLWSLVFLQSGRHFLASIMFSLSLNFKQMSLYFALPFFFHMLGEALHLKSWRGSFSRIFFLGAGVILTFGTLWVPFYAANGLEGLGQLIHRLFPVARGLFEDKVANFWCTIDLVVKLKRIVDPNRLFPITVAFTLLGLLPSGVDLLKRPSYVRLVFSLFVSSMSFYLFSFQVHEKTILFPLLPMTLLAGKCFEEFCWMTLVSMFSMYPLLIRDGQSIPYFSLFVFFLSIAFAGRQQNASKFKRIAQFLSLLGMMSIHIIFASMKPPAKLPDLFVLLFTSFSFLHFAAFFLWANYVQFTMKESSDIAKLRRKIWVTVLQPAKKSGPGSSHAASLQSGGVAAESRKDDQPTIGFPLSITYAFITFQMNLLKGYLPLHDLTWYQGRLAQLRGHALLQVLRERKSVPSTVGHFDKIFASIWLSEDHVLFSTKDGKLIYWDTYGGRSGHITVPPRTKSNPGVVNSFGSHFLAQNEECTFLLSTGEDSTELAVYSLPSLDCVNILRGHQDWVFGAAFIDQHHFVSGSRDCTVKMWNVTADATESSQCIATRLNHTKKVRAICFDRVSCTFSSLSADRTIKIWDPSRMDVISEVLLTRAPDLVCIDVKPDAGLLAVGSLEHFTFIDIRSRHLVSVPSKDESLGVRSLVFVDNVLSIGGGKGYLSFYDIRAGRFMPVDDEGKEYFTSGRGWLDKNEAYLSYFHDTTVHNAIYTHSYNPSKTKIFVGGGPLMAEQKKRPPGGSNPRPPGVNIS
ncbi:hypothetical protein PROFUN_08952 [Planoprotostelium fungivorum]|uniref:dolichyl-P-Glc:Man9GlcNAc2-PP-dolichol alpha-1,3-glucosyltransferase n=1 Tax=Planoprotostelium fungivorum TaxID=1890364 RepID=A0A2P6NIR8_9EUKA|nr:hypothetical protein PROFUN_08952 [Planoprotostelium fungivorum]